MRPKHREAATEAISASVMTGTNVLADRSWAAEEGPDHRRRGFSQIGKQRKIVLIGGEVGIRAFKAGS
jgi:hypothetical protein